MTSHAERIAEQLRMAEEERAATESDNDNETMSETDNTDETESTETETPIGTEFDVPPTGMLALDRTDLEGNRCVVIAHHNTRAGDFTVAATGKSIAEHQREWEDEEWAEDVERAPVVDVAYKGRLEERWDEEWQEWPASLLTYRVGNEGMRTYTFPVTRLLFGPEYAEVITEQGREPADTTSETPADPGVTDVACKECGFEAAEGDTKADYAVHFDECPECGGEIHGRLVDAEEGDVVTDGGVDLRRGKPIHALGGGARKDHLFTDKRSLCGKYMWGGGRAVSPEDVSEEDDDLCKKCARDPRASTDEVEA